MRWRDFFAYILYCSCFNLQGISLAASKPYNVVLLIADDLNVRIGANDASRANQSYTLAATPNIDALLNRGVRFENAHVSFAACAPSRAAMMTGRRNDALRMWDTRERYFRRRNANVKTLPGVLRANGYTTVGLGKVMDNRNHVLVNGAPEVCTKKSTECSWDEYLTTETIMSKSRKLCGVKTELFPGEPLNDDRTAHLIYGAPSENTGALHDSCLTKVAIEKLNELSSNRAPFFLAVGWRLPHMPWVMPEEYLLMYDNLTDEDRSLTEVQRFWTEESNSRSRSLNREIQSYDPHGNVSSSERIKGYLAATSFVDQQVGEFMRSFSLIPEDVAAETILIFWSDHGFHLGDNGLWGKWTLFEQATKVPFGIVPPSRYFSETNRKLRGGGVGSEVLSPVESVDILPTILEMCGITAPPGISGTSLVPLLFAPSSFVRAAAVSQMWSYDRWHRSMGYSIRSMNYRLVVYTKSFNKDLKNKARLPYGSFKKAYLYDAELYDYASDGPFEKLNRFGDPAYSNITAALMKLWNHTVDRQWSDLVALKPPDYTLHEIDGDAGEEEPLNETSINSTNITAPSVLTASILQFIHYYDKKCTPCANIRSFRAWQNLIPKVSRIAWDDTTPERVAFMLNVELACSLSTVESVRKLLNVLLPRHSFDTTCSGFVGEQFVLVTPESPSTMPTFTPVAQPPPMPSITPAPSPIASRPKNSSTLVPSQAPAWTRAPSLEVASDGVDAVPVAIGVTAVGFAGLIVVFIICSKKRQSGADGDGKHPGLYFFGALFKPAPKQGTDSKSLRKAGAPEQPRAESQPEENSLDPALHTSSSADGATILHTCVAVENSKDDVELCLPQTASWDETTMREPEEDTFHLARTKSHEVTSTTT